MTAALGWAARVLAVLALVGAFGYGFMARVDRRSVGFAVAATLLYSAAFAPLVLGQYSFPRCDVLAWLAAAGLVALGLSMAAFVRWPQAVAPTLALLAAVRLPIPVHREVDIGAAPEYLFLLVPLYVATVGALFAEAFEGGGDVQPSWRLDPLRLPFFCLVAWAALTTLMSPGPVQSAIRLFSFWILLPAAYHALWRALRRGGGRGPAPTWLASVESLAALGVVLAAVGIDQHFRRWLLFRNTNLEATEWQQVIFRVNAIFWDPNMFARFLVLVGLLAGALWFGCSGRRRLWGLALVPIGVALCFTYSRSAWLAAAAVIGLVAWLRVGFKRAVAVIAVLAIVLAAAFLLIRAPTFRRTTVQVLEATLGVVKEGKLELTTPVNKLTGGRYGLMVGGVRMFAARPLTGWGLGSFPSVYPRFRPADAPARLRESHNSVITVAAEMGAIGLALLAWSLVAVVGTARRALSRRAPVGVCEPHPFAVAVTAGLFGLLLHSMFYSALIEDPFTWTLLALLVTLGVAGGGAPKAQAGDAGASSDGAPPPATPAGAPAAVS